MKIAIDLLKAEHVGVRELKAGLSRRLKTHKTIVITDHGSPVKVILPYSDVLELLDILDEVTDPKMVKLVQEGRRAVQKGSQGIPVEHLFNKKRAQGYV